MNSSLKEGLMSFDINQKPDEADQSIKKDEIKEDFYNEPNLYKKDSNR